MKKLTTLMCMLLVALVAVPAAAQDLPELGIIDLGGGGGETEVGEGIDPVDEWAWGECSALADPYSPSVNAWDECWPAEGWEPFTGELQCTCCLKNTRCCWGEAGSGTCAQLGWVIFTPEGPFALTADMCTSPEWGGTVSTLEACGTVTVPISDPV